jgi:hypothetical protein
MDDRLSGVVFFDDDDYDDDGMKVAPTLSDLATDKLETG